MAKLFYFYGTTKKGIETMNFLEEKIVKEGVVKEGNILKVDSFLNHQMDVKLFKQMGEEFKKRFADKPINKILTVEASGIGIACIVAECFDVPVVFAKKSKSVNIDGEVYNAEVESFTHKCKNQVLVSMNGNDIRCALGGSLYSLPCKRMCIAGTYFYCFTGRRNSRGNRNCY